MIKGTISLLAFDFGLKHIGVAAGQTRTCTASPVTTVSAKNGKPEWVHLETLLKEWQPSLLLVGLPLNMDDSESDMSKRARKFARRLNARFNLPVEMVDERLSSFEANYHDVDATKKHAIAAAIIAQTWFSNQQAAATD